MERLKESEGDKPLKDNKIHLLKQCFIRLQSSVLSKPLMVHDINRLQRALTLIHFTNIYLVLVYYIHLNTHHQCNRAKIFYSVFKNLHCNIIHSTLIKLTWSSSSSISPTITTLMSPPIVPSLKSVETFLERKNQH